MNRPSDILKPDQEVQAEIIDLDREKRRMTLSLKRLQQPAARSNENNSGRRVSHDERGSGNSIGEILASKMGKDKLNNITKNEEA